VTGDLKKQGDFCSNKGSCTKLSQLDTVKAVGWILRSAVMLDAMRDSRISRYVT